MLKTIAILIIASIAAVLLFAATRPDTFRVERSITIKAPPSRIYPLINDLKGFATWSPYEKKDPAMKREFSGPASGPGAAYAWDGNKDIGAGSLKIVEATAPSKVTMKLDFLRPFEASNMAEFTLTPVSTTAGEATQVTWAMHGASPFVAKVMGLVFNMDKMVGKDFEEGLASLKAATEK